MVFDGLPIEPDWKISRVLETYPALLDTLVGLTPAFARLRNPVLRRVQSRLVTVEQAAGIAGLPVADVLRTLNEAAGGATPLPPRANTDTHLESRPERPTWIGSDPVAAHLDVRPILDRGEEPFAAITAQARSVPVGSVMLLEAGFEPVPLYDALGKLGFDHWSEQLGEGHWQVHFRRSLKPGADSPARDVPDGDRLDWSTAPNAEVAIDVSELVPPEPMMKILATLDTLPTGSSLLVHHVRRPIHLYPQLDERGYLHATRDIGPRNVEILVHKPLAADGDA